MHAEIDHLIVAARTLDEGVAWCRATLGVTPAPGGAHPLMGTHNRLLAIGSPAHPRAYLEIIAIDPGATPVRRPPLRRWFDLDDAALQAGLARHGPRLIHAVVRVPDVRAALHALAHGGATVAHIDRGTPIAAARDTATGRLEWQITVRDDGQRLFYGALPTLIQWGPMHPTDALPASGVTLRALRASHPRAADLAAAFVAIGLDRVPVQAGPPDLVAELETPFGKVTLASNGL